MLFWDNIDRSIVALSALVSSTIISSSGSNALVSLVSWTSVLLACLRLLDAPGWRWQVFWRTLPLYTCNSLLACMLLLGADVNERRCLWIGGYLLGAISLLTAIVLFIFPVPSAGRLHGPHKEIGTFSFNLPLLPDDGHADMDRTNSFVAVQCWFPMKSTRCSPQGWRGWLFKQQKALLWTSGHPSSQLAESTALLQFISREYLKGPGLLLEHLSLARTNSIHQPSLGAVETSPAMPVAIYSHGMYGWRQIHRTACEALASEGYLVLACDHSPDCMIARPPLDGDHQTHPYQPFDFHVPDDTDERIFYMKGMRRRLRDVDQLVCFLQSLDGHHSAPPAAWKPFADIFQPLHGRLDMNKLCLWGHSFGAGTMTAFSCSRSAHHRHPAAVIALDSWMYPVPNKIRQRGLQGPVSVLNMSAELWQWGKYQAPFRADVLKNSQKMHVGFDMVVKEANHQNFCEVFVLANPWLMRKAGVLGSVNPRKANRAMNAIICAFFRSSLLNGQDESKLMEETESAKQSSRSKTDHLLEFCCKSVHGQQEVKSFMEQFIVHESEIENFADYTVFNRVLKSD